jgi:hypothetical protein
MANRVKKQALPEPSGRVHKDRQLADNLLRFSFRHFAETEKFGYPTAEDQKPHYWATLISRLRDVSNMSISEFRTTKSKSLRAHKHDGEYVRAEWLSPLEPAATRVRAVAVLLDRKRVRTRSRHTR